MGRATTTKKAMLTSTESSPFTLRTPKEAAKMADRHVHIIRNGVRCDTENRGFSSPRGRSPLEIVVDASEGFVPLWEKGATLRWRFQEGSLQIFQDPEGAKTAIEQLLGEAILAWGEAAPVKFARRDDAWDFEIVVREADECNVTGCVLASAFFPDAGQHQLTIYPKLFSQDRQEQVETLIHEIGHIFGLRHFFALVEETAWPAEVFGAHNKFSIMNYGDDSRLTSADKSDLKTLYQQAWNGHLTDINGTPIKFVRPFHTAGEVAATAVAVAAVRTDVHAGHDQPQG
ncbi:MULTISPECIES: matrixin family metalloprotease [unclassified Sinorhizobium]|uniref:matrixin family metalloprotease n=1 Tax=unclassified Sinorhizobium TaxID=2613772 RepID=UPI00352528D4